MALAANTVFEFRTGGAITNGGGFRWQSLVNATYRWTLSGGGTNEYYCELAAGGDPGLTQPRSVTLDGKFNLAASGAVGSLAAGTWAWGDGDTLGYSTVYVRLADGSDPDSKIALGQIDYVEMGYGGGQDYSQQNGAQLSLLDIATDVAGTGISSVTGGFTANMVSNLIYLTGGGSTAGWYEITAVADSNTATIDRSAGASKAGVTGNVGGALTMAGITTAFIGSTLIAGHRSYIKSGNYALSATITYGNGTATDPIQTLGYKTVRGDNPTGNDRPLISGFAVQVATYNVVANIRWTAAVGSAGVLSTSGSNNLIYNCKFTNTAAGAGSHAFVAAGAILIVQCEGSTAGAAGGSYAFNFSSGATVAIGCYAHDSDEGFHMGGIGSACFVCIARTGRVGFSHNAEPTSAVNCSTYAMTYGHYVPLVKATAIVNCAGQANTNDIYDNQASIQRNVWSINNCLGSANPFRNAVNYWGNLFANPGMMNPAADDFRVSLADPVAKKAADAGTGTGARTY